MKKYLLVFILTPLLFYCHDKSVSNNEIDSGLTFLYPLEKYNVIQNFGNMNSNFGNKYHCAEDSEGNGGTAVYAISDGTITYSGTMGGYGWLIIIDHTLSNVYSLYGHLSTRRDKVLEGEVKRGDLIAYLADDDEDGSGGQYPNWSPHLHFSIRRGEMLDYPNTGENRWMAGYTEKHPTEHNWLNPSEFIQVKINK